MKRAIDHRGAGRWPHDEEVASVTLDFARRHRRRLRVDSDSGEAILLDLPKAVAMADGDGLLLDGGGWLRVRAAPESLLEIVCATPLDLLRLAWHLGNRHLPTEIRASALRIRPDHVIADMARGLGAEVRAIEAPFQPEGGAYGQQHAHGDHHHAHGHGHGHRHHHG